MYMSRIATLHNVLSSRLPKFGFFSLTSFTLHLLEFNLLFVLTTTSKKEMVPREQRVRHPIGSSVQQVHDMPLCVARGEVNRETHVTERQSILVIDIASNIKLYDTKLWYFSLFEKKISMVHTQIVTCKFYYDLSYA